MKNSISTESYVLGGIAAFLIIMFVFAMGGGAATPEALGEKLFKAIQTENKKSAERLMITSSAMVSLIDKSDIPDDVREEIKEEAKDKKRLQNAFEGMWLQMEEELEERGVDPKELELVEVKFEIKESKGLEAARIGIFSKRANGEAVLFKTEALHHTGWMMVPEMDVEFD